MPTRILHVIGGMNRGGVETWLMHVLRHIDRKRFQMDFLVHTDRACAFDGEIRALGSRIIPCLWPSKPWQYYIQLERILREQGPYNVVHSHVHHFSGVVLRVAERSGIRYRIAHSHNDISVLAENASLLRRMYFYQMQRWIRRHATIGLACSQQAASSLYGPMWHRDGRWNVLSYCLPFESSLTELRGDVRGELALPPGALVIGHVGRFHPQKNHSFLISCFSEVARRHAEARLLLVGDGPLRPQIERQAAAAGLEELVLFTGVRADVLRLMQAMDVLAFPSLHEGLGLVVVEAQSLGLPCLISSAVPNEATVVPELVTRMPLNVGAAEWAERLIDIASAKPKFTRQEARSRVLESPFNIDNCIKALEDAYSG